MRRDLDAIGGAHSVEKLAEDLISILSPETVPAVEHAIDELIETHPLRVDDEKVLGIIARSVLGMPV